MLSESECGGIQTKGRHLWVPYKVLNLGESECCYFCGVQRLRTGRIIEDHRFVGVVGHSDDDECTYRSDGTDETYCGAQESEHVWSTR